MGRKVSFELDDKAVDVERENLLHLKDDCSYSVEDASVLRTRRYLFDYSRESLPSIKDVINLLLFSAVTVIGWTFISEIMPTIGWSNVGDVLRRPLFFYLSLLQKPMSDPHDHGSIPVATNNCHSSIHNASLSMDFVDPTKFTFAQISEEPLNSANQIFNFVRITGSIEVRNRQKSSGSYVHADLDIHGSDSRLIGAESLKIAKTDSSLILHTPKRLPREVTPDEANIVPCLHISAVLTIAAGARLENLNLNSETLSVRFQPDLDYAESRVVDTKTNFDSMSTYSRETIIDVHSASVSGSYPLYDLLSIHTNSGSINTEIVPKNASRETVKPAVLRLSSNSGSIRSRTSTISVPDRDYQSSFSTSSGSIDAVTLHGLRTSLRSINGRVTADLHPYGHNDSRTDIESHCTSGAMDVSLHSSVSHPTAPLKKLYGYYRGVSGSLNIFYPAQWQGVVEGTTSSGGVDLNWQGLKVIKDGKDGFIKRRIEAVRGEGEGKLEFHETSGRTRLSGESGGVLESLSSNES